MSTKIEQLLKQANLNNNYIKLQEICSSFGEYVENNEEIIALTKIISPLPEFHILLGYVLNSLYLKNNNDNALNCVIYLLNLPLKDNQKVFLKPNPNADNFFLVRLANDERNNAKQILNYLIFDYKVKKLVCYKYNEKVDNLFNERALISLKEKEKKQVLKSVNVQKPNNIKIKI